MKLKTRFFGEIEVFENKIIVFDEGIPGFEDLKKFLFMTDEEDDSPFCWLQSIEKIDIVFTLFDVFKIKPDYNPDFNIQMIDTLGDAKDEDLFLYCMTQIPKNVKDMSINLKAPIIINTNTNKARQIICNNDNYDIRYYIYK